MITAEQVREAIEENSWKEAFMLHEFNESSWQAIADELNAALGAGTCKNKATSLRTFWCDCCDCALEDWMDVGGKLVNGLRYCPNCGRKVEG